VCGLCFNHVLLSVCAAYKLSVHVNEMDKNKPLQISHFPQILGSESTKVAQTITVIRASFSQLIPLLFLFRGMCYTICIVCVTGQLITLNSKHVL